MTDDKASVLQQLTWLATRLQEPLDLEQVLQAAAAFAARVSGVERASVHLLDREGLLVATARAGSPVHFNNDVRWTLGEGLIGWVAENRQVLRTGEAPNDPRFLHRDDMTVPIQSFLGVPILRSETCVGVPSSSHQEPDRFSERHEAAAVLLAAICAPYIEMARLARLSTADALTGLLNRRGVDDGRVESRRVARRAREPRRRGPLRGQSRRAGSSSDRPDLVPLRSGWTRRHVVLSLPIIGTGSEQKACLRRESRGDNGWEAAHVPDPGSVR